MKKIFTTGLLVLIALSSFATTKKIAFVSTATPTTAGDSLIRKELAKTYQLVYVNAGSGDSATVSNACNADSIDMVLVSEPVSTSSATGLVGVQGVNKPVLNMKIFAYKSSAKTWGWSSTTLWGDNSSVLTLDSVAGQTSHSIFSGLSFPISVIDSVTSSKGLEYANIATLTSGTITNLAKLAGTSNVSIFEIAAGSSVTNVYRSAAHSIPKKFISFGINTLSQKNLNATGLKLIVNICDYLTTGTGTGVKEVSSDVNFKAISSTGSLLVQVPASGTVKVISISGALVAQKVVSSEASFSLAQGTYVVQYISGSTTTAKTVIVK